MKSLCKSLIKSGFGYNPLKLNMIKFSNPTFLSFKSFTDCGKSGCGCHSPKEEDELEKTLKSKHSKILECIDTGKFDEALNLSDDFISLVKSNFGVEHPFYCSAVNNKAFILKTCGEFDDAKPLFQEVINKYTALYGEANEKTVISLHNYATLLKDSREYEESTKIYEKLLKVISGQHLQIEGEKTGKLRLNIIANIYNSAGGLYRQVKNFKESERLFNLAYQIVKENFGEETLPIATILNNMALSHKDQGQIAEAKEKYTKALEIMKKILPENHPEFLTTKHNLEQLQNNHLKTNDKI